MGHGPLGPDQPLQATSRPEKQIRIRNLMTHLLGGGRVTEARLVEREDDRWMIYLCLADRPGEHRVNIYRSNTPKTYRDLRLAVDTVRQMFCYPGPITLVTTKPASQPDRRPEVGDEEQ